MRTTAVTTRMEIFNTDQDIRRVLMQLINGYYSPQDPELFRDIYNSLLNTKNSDQGRYLLHPERFPFLCGSTETRRGSLP